MTDFQALREIVIVRLGSPEPVLPGEYYEEGTPAADWAYRRWEEYLDETDYEPDAEGVEHFVADLEAKRAHDFRAFHHGRDMLLAALPVFVEFPSDPDPEAPISTTKVIARSGANLELLRLRERVITRLGRPAGRVPGENYTWTSTDDQWAMTQLADRLEYQLSVRTINEAIEAIAAVRDRDRPAFNYGRAELLSLLPVRLEPPKAG